MWQKAAQCGKILRLSGFQNLNILNWCIEFMYTSNLYSYVAQPVPRSSLKYRCLSNFIYVCIKYMYMSNLGSYGCHSAALEQFQL